MMKLLPFVTALCGLSVCAAAGEYDQLPFQYDLKYFQLNGSVLQVREKQWLPSRDSFFFNTAASLTPDNSYRLERSLDLQFNAGGQVLNQNSSLPDERKRNELKATGRSFYYQKDKLIAIRDTEGKDKADSVAYHYKKNGLMDYYTVFNGKNDLVYKMSYVYKNGRVATVRKNDKENRAVSMVKYKYIDTQLQECQYFDEQYRLTETRRYSFKAMPEGQLNESYAVTLPDGHMKEGMSLVKDSLGRILEQNVINGEREVTEYRSFQYGQQGQPVAEKVFSSLQESDITNRYTYDDKGNWIKKEIFYSGRLRSVILRELQYAG